MPEKFFDIFPPKTFPVLKSEKGFQETPSEPSPKIPPKTLPKKPLKPVLRTAKKKFSIKKIITFIVFGVLILAGIFLYFALSRAQIEIWPETETLNFKDRVQIDTQKSQPDFSAKIFPGKIFEDDLEASQDFSSTGKISKAEKAQGQIRVYNAYSNASQALIVNTRFISSEGKLFKSLERITIPGGTYDSKGKLTPGFLDVRVIAAESGPGYNIGPSTFSIPGFVGTPKYTAFYGKSTSAMTGGFEGEASQVAQTDLDNAKDTLVKKLVEEEKASLKNKISPDIVLLNEALVEEIASSTSSAQAGAEAKNFNLRIKIHFKALTFKKSDLDSFAKGFLDSQVVQKNQHEIFGAESFWTEKKIQENSFKIDYSLYSIDWQAKKIFLDLNFSAKIYPDINSKNLKKAVSGKSSKEVQVLLSNQPYVKKSEIKLWPFWVKKIPQSEGRIRINLSLEG